MRLLARTVVLVGLLSGAIVIPTTSASAYVFCRTSYGSRFAGYLTSGSDSSGLSFEGTKANIENNTGPICDDDESTLNFNTTWVMISENESAGGGRGYAQSGYFRYWGSCTYWYSEYRKNPSDSYHRTIHTGYGCRTGSGSDFSVVWGRSGVANESLIAGSPSSGTVLGSTPWDPFAAWSSAGNFEPEISSETKYIGSDVPGTSADPTNITSVELQNFDNSWTTSTQTLPSMNDICPWPVRYSKSNFGGHAFSFYSTTSTSTSLNC